MAHPDDEQIADGGADETAAPEGGDTPSVSMEDTLRESLRAIQARDNAGGEDETAPDGETVDDPAGDPPEGKPAEGRDPKTGKFVAKDGRPPAAKPPAKGQPGADGKPAEGAPPAQGNTNPDNLVHVGRDGKQYPVDITKPPASWRGEAQAEFGKLPENVRREIYKRENDFHRGLSEARGWANVGQALDREIQPYAAMIQSRGHTAPQVVKTLLANAYTFASGTPEEKANLLLQIVEQYGITPESVKAAQTRRATGQPAVSPEVAALRKELGEVKGRLSREDQAREQAESSQAMDQVSTFMADPKNVYANEVGPEMARLLQTGGASDLQDAYDKACWSSPTVRAKLIAQQQETERKRKADEAAAARKAAGANVTRRGKPPEVQPQGTMDDTLRATLRRIKSRA